MIALELGKVGTSNLNAARDAVTDIVAACVPCAINGLALEMVVMERLAQSRPVKDLDDAVLIAVAGMAIARLVEHERGERSTAV